MATIIRNEKLFCTCCGSEHALKFPIALDVLNEKIKAFEKLHEDCEQTWIEPEADQSKDVKEKAMWWMANGETGLSSKTMWNCFMDKADFPINHPSDPDDFSRCYKLLKAVPEWKDELYKLKPLSPAWSNLVDNWDELTDMFERNVSENWANYKEIGMYELMKKLLYEA